MMLRRCSLSRSLGLRRASMNDARLLSRRGLLVIAQHKPYSFLSPSTNPRGNKQFAVDLLRESNRRLTPLSVMDRKLRIDDTGLLMAAGRLDADSTG